jgi:hypothetical protein
MTSQRPRTQPQKEKDDYEESPPTPPRKTTTTTAPPVPGVESEALQLIKALVTVAYEDRQEKMKERLAEAAKAKAEEEARLKRGHMVPFGECNGVT